MTIIIVDQIAFYVAFNFYTFLQKIYNVFILLKIIKNVHWLYNEKTFELSAVRLQPSMNRNGKNDNYIIYKK